MTRSMTSLRMQGLVHDNRSNRVMANVINFTFFSLEPFLKINQVVFMIPNILMHGDQSHMRDHYFHDSQVNSVNAQDPLIYVDLYLESEIIIFMILRSTASTQGTHMTLLSSSAPTVHYQQSFMVKIFNFDFDFLCFRLIFHCDRQITIFCWKKLCPVSTSDTSFPTD